MTTEKPKFTVKGLAIVVAVLALVSIPSIWVISMLWSDFTHKEGKSVTQEKSQQPIDYEKFNEYKVRMNSVCRLTLAEMSAIDFMDCRAFLDWEDYVKKFPDKKNFVEQLQAVTFDRGHSQLDASALPEYCKDRASNLTPSEFDTCVGDDYRESFKAEYSNR